jgi:bifunctional DNA-binding transcriptional regulator/antitoxin component of YhaV-PrlF toxin-antitoxin module
MLKRKILTTNNRTKMICLPSQWCDAVELGIGDTVIFQMNGEELIVKKLEDETTPQNAFV